MKRGRIAVEAARRWQEQRAKVGGQVRAIRLRRGWTQAELAARAGVGRMVVGRIERGEVRLDLEVLERLAAVLGVPLRVELGRDPREGPADAGHLAIQEVVLRLARAAGLERRFELATKPIEPWRSVDVWAGSERQRVAVDIECWNTFGDIGAATRSSARKTAELDHAAVARWGEDARAVHVWVVRDAARNRALIERYPEVFATRFPGSSRAWVAALTDGGRIPTQAGLVWCDLREGRILAWRRPGRRAA